MPTVTYPYATGQIVYVLEECGVKKGIVQSVVITDVFNSVTVTNYIQLEGEAGAGGYSNSEVYPDVDAALAAEKARIG